VDTKLISLIVPAYNEEGNLEELYQRVSKVMKPLAYDYEVIIIDNCSEDNTEAVCRSLCERDAKWRYIRFSRNFTAEVSLAAGIHHARGDAIINVFSDLQDPPELIPQMIAKWEEGYDVVYGIIHQRRDHSLAKQLGTRVAYSLIYWLSECKIPPNAADFRLISRDVARALDQFREQDRYLRGLTHWVGFRQIGIPYERQARKWGRTKAGFWWCVGFALRAILSFSVVPLRLASYFGLITSVLCFCLGVLYFMFWIFAKPPSGWTTLALLIFFQIGLQSLFIGIAGEYLARTYQEVKRRPLWIIQRSVNIDTIEKIGQRHT
jgi:glycosyltransferase involved in cell wall biosynthesis